MMISRKLIFTIFAVVLFLFTPYYVYSEMGWIIQMTLADPERWNRSAWADNDVVIPMTMRIFYLWLWTVPITVGVLGLVAGIFVCWRARSGNYFDALLARAISWVGLSMVIGSALAIAAGSISPTIVSWCNAEGPLPLRFWHGSNPSIMLAGFAFIMFGTILRDAIKLAQENNEFV